MTAVRRTFAGDLLTRVGSQVMVRGCIYRLRVLAKTTFLIVRDCTGEVQCVGPTATVHELRPKVDDVIEVHGTVRQDHRARGGIEMDVQSATLLIVRPPPAVHGFVGCLRNRSGHPDRVPPAGLAERSRGRRSGFRPRF